MSRFLRLLAEDDKAQVMLRACVRLRRGEVEPLLFEVDPASFDTVPGKPFAYWVTEGVRGEYQRLEALHNEEAGRSVWSTNPLNDDFRYVRLWWEIDLRNTDPCWMPWAKGGAFSEIYFDIHTVIHWSMSRGTFFGFIGTENRPLERPASVQHFFRPGITWPRRTQQFGPRVMPRGCIFADKGPAAFVRNDDLDRLLAILALMVSRPFAALLELRLNAGDSTARSFEVGLVQETPVPDLDEIHQSHLAKLVNHAWSLKRALDTIEETSHAFLLPAALRARLDDCDPPAIEVALANIRAEIDNIVFKLYGFSETDRAALMHPVEGEVGSAAEVDDESIGRPADVEPALLSWIIGVAFGRFDWRLATGQRIAPLAPTPFDPLPARSPGMLLDDSEAFHSNAGILVDDPGHSNDLTRLVEEVLVHVNAPVPPDVRRWLQRDFFQFHLQQYGKSRRKAPIYWPLSTVSGAYTLWIYYPRLTSQTLYTAVNDFIEPKLKQLEQEAVSLGGRADARSRDEDRMLEVLQTLKGELVDLRETLLQIAPTFQPNHDDGVQITAAPLWKLFRHKPWAKVLKETWARLESGDYDWAHLAMAYWPDRVRDKCKTDKSLAIAHNLESLYVEPAPKLAKVRGRRKESDE